MNSQNLHIQTQDSFVNIPGSWDTRKISLWGVARSVISQLNVGTDLTKVMLPADFQAPYSLLELCAARYLGHFAILKSLHKQQDPLQRIIHVIKFFLACTMELKFERKPYNSDLGETHTAVSGSSTFYAQQVSHHPPITAFAIVDTQRTVELQGNMGAEITFKGNGVTAETTGFVEIEVVQDGDDREVYRLNKGLPAMAINNVIWGTRVMNWAGDVIIECKKSGYSAVLNFSGNANDKNMVSGVISKNDTPVYKFSPTLWSKHSIQTDSDKIHIFSPSEIHKEIKFQYPNKSDPMETLNVWKEVTHYIVNEDLQKADEANHTRRTRAHKRAAIRDPGLERNYFKLDEKKNGWILNPEGLALYPSGGEEVKEAENVEVTENTETTETTETTDQGEETGQEGK